MKKSKPKFILLKITPKFILFNLLGLLGVINLILLPQNNVLSIEDWIIGLFENGWFSDYLGTSKPTSRAVEYFVYNFSIKILIAHFGLVLYRITPYNHIGLKLLTLLFLIFTIKDIVFNLHNNNTLLPWLDYVLYGIILLFVLIRGWRWKYECLTSESRDFRYLQFTIKRPSKLKHLVGAVIKMTPAGTYRALIYDSDTGTDKQWHFPGHKSIENISYYPNSKDVVKTALDNYGKPIPASKALEYIEANKNKEYHAVKNNCDNYWADLCGPSKLFRVTLKRK